MLIHSHNNRLNNKEVLVMMITKIDRNAVEFYQGLSTLTKMHGSTDLLTTDLKSVDAVGRMIEFLMSLFEHDDRCV